MSGYVVLLRGINVGGHNKIPMAELRQLLGQAGFDQVATYIQSGNVVLEAGDRSEGEVVTEVERVVGDGFDLAIPVVARPVDHWSDILARNPFPHRESEPKRLHVYLCAHLADPAALAAFDPTPYAPDQLRADGREFYVWYENGAGKSKLSNAVIERELGVTATARNWSTMLKLADMAAALQS